MSISISGTASYQSVSVTVQSTSVTVNGSAVEDTAAQVSGSGTTEAANTDSVSISGKNSNVDVQALIDQNNERIANFKNQILSMIGKQGGQAALASANTGKLQAGNGYAEIFGFDEDGNFDPTQRITVAVTPEESAEAAASLEGDGEWSVSSVASRIMDMATAFAGNDTEKLEEMRAAVQEGFRQAGFDPDDRENSIMPEITGQTYDEIMSRFDALEGKDDAEDVSDDVTSEITSQVVASSIAGANDTDTSKYHHHGIDIRA